VTARPDSRSEPPTFGTRLGTKLVRDRLAAAAHPHRLGKQANKPKCQKQRRAASVTFTLGPVRGVAPGARPSGAGIERLTARTSLMY